MCASIAGAAGAHGPPRRPARSRHRRGRSSRDAAQVRARRRRVDHLGQRAVTDQGVVDGRGAHRVLDTEGRARVALRVEVDDQGAQPVERQRDAEVDRGRRLADAALLVGDRDDADPARRRERLLVCGMQHARGAQRLHGDRAVQVRTRPEMPSRWRDCSAAAHPGRSSRVLPDDPFHVEPIELLYLFHVEQKVGLCGVRPGHRAPRVMTTTVVAASPRAAPTARAWTSRIPAAASSGSSAGSSSTARVPTRATSWVPGRISPRHQPTSRGSGATARAVTTSTVPTAPTTDRSSARPRTTRQRGALPRAGAASS